MAIKLLGVWPALGRRCLWSCIFRLFVPLFALVLFVHAASSEKVIHTFATTSGASPYSTLVFDGAGNLYGTTQGGGSSNCSGGCGTVFRLVPASGGWSYQLLHKFQGQDGNDGAYPSFTSSLVLDTVGNVYGSTSQAGIHGYGTIFEVSPTANGPWKENIIHSFTNGDDGALPQAGLTFDLAGNLYSTTTAGGYFGMGTVFQLQPKTGGGWMEPVNTLFNFTTENGSYAPVVFDSAGDAYGTEYGGGQGYGFVCEFSSGKYGWVQKPLFNFLGGSHGGEPMSGLLLDASGNLYGTTGGTYGTAYKLAPDLNGTWTETTVHEFDYGPGGNLPRSGLAEDASGNLYGTTYGGGAYGYGTVYKLVPNPNGSWTENVVYNFTGGADGAGPIGGVILDQAGRLFGTASAGGNGAGVVFEIEQ